MFEFQLSWNCRVASFPPKYQNSSSNVTPHPPTKMASFGYEKFKLSFTIPRIFQFVHLENSLNYHQMLLVLDYLTCLSSSQPKQCLETLAKIHKAWFSNSITDYFRLKHNNVLCKFQSHFTGRNCALDVYLR